MSSWIEQSVKEYYDWLRGRTVIQKDDTTGWYLISTPYVGLFNETINLYAKREGLDKIVLSDDGNTFDNLSNMGVVINSSPELKELVERVSIMCGVQINDRNEIFVETSISKFVRDMHNIVSAIMEIFSHERKL